MIEQKIAPSNLGFWTLAIIYVQSTLASYQENQIGASQNGKCSKETKFVKYRKLLFLNQIFLYDRAKNRPPNLGFWTLAIIYVQSTLASYQENQIGASQIGKCSKETKFVKYRKFLFLIQIFRYDWGINQPHQPICWVFVIVYSQTVFAIFPK